MKTLTGSNALTRSVPAAALLLALAGPPLAAQVLHVNDRWEDCAMVLDPSLTQEAWHQFVGEVGFVTYFRPLTAAKPLGTKRFEVSVLSASTRIDDADDAWNDTFSHPDPTHYLFEGDALPIPGLMARMGVTDRVDVGAYFTKNGKSNYGMFGGQASGFVAPEVGQDPRRPRWSGGARSRHREQVT